MNTHSQNKLSLWQSSKQMIKISEVMAASIVAKVFRDSLMIDFGRKFSDFLLKKIGYPTKNI